MEKYAALLAVLACLSCTGADTALSSGEEPAAPVQRAEMPATEDLAAGRPGMGRSGAEESGAASPGAAAEETLERFAELERSGAYIRGMGLAESGLREHAGDFAGAALAAYKELAWAYGHGAAEKADLERALENVLRLEGEREAGAVQAARGLGAFMHGRWKEAEAILGPLFEADEEPDGFARWLLLTCALEQNRGDRKAGAAYGAIRARYTGFPEYWYRGARFFSGPVATEYAERCIGLAPEGPFAGECREILAASTGLDPRNGAALKSRREIEELLSRAVSGNNPELLSGLLPLISLPDNSYTVYAVGALQALAMTPRFGEYLAALEKKSSGRLAERLRYICGGRR
jgi:hypothetical protein